MLCPLLKTFYGAHQYLVTSPSQPVVEAVAAEAAAVDVAEKSLPVLVGPEVSVPVDAGLSVPVDSGTATLPLPFPLGLPCPP